LRARIGGLKPPKKDGETDGKFMNGSSDFFMISTSSIHPKGD
jgi:hypothetical protein